MLEMKSTSSQLEVQTVEFVKNILELLENLLNQFDLLKVPITTQKSYKICF